MKRSSILIVFLIFYLCAQSQDKNSEFPLGSKQESKNKIAALSTLIVPDETSDFENNSQFEPFAVIELFTSQGCSSCPAADRLLSQTIAEAEKNGNKIFALSFHVDYWNRLGWTDPFSDKKYSRRQQNYVTQMNLSSAYTPQMIVNGSSEFVGSNKVALEKALVKSLNEKPITGFKTLSAYTQMNNPLCIKYELEGSYSGCKINFALVSLKETTSVKRGENIGHDLKSENVVRQFISLDAAANGEMKFEISPEPPLNNLAVIAYIQQSDLKIIGAAMTEIK